MGLVFAPAGHALGNESLNGGAPGLDDTLLMFVGEDLEVLTIASRREESARQAPAVAQVIPRRQFREEGAFTLGQVLDSLPGFHMAPKENGVQPYLRGIPESILFLHDTVPTSSDISKSFHPLDQDLSLSAVKRVEIIRGPGSVLWGPDAFAGIVNVVPLTGKDLHGVETALRYGEPGEQKNFFVNAGREGGGWDGFFSISGHEGELDDGTGTVTRFWGDGLQPIPPDERFGAERPGDSHHLEANGNASFGDWLTLSGRFGDNRRKYSLESEPGISWLENRDHQTGNLKIEARKRLDPFSVLRWMGSYSWLDIEHQIIDRTLSQREATAYTELIYDRSLWSGDGLLTAGLSYREKRIENAPVWEGYFPDYLRPENVFLLPIINEVDYDTRLRSVFGQYNHQFGDFQGWIGLRLDDHDSYQDHLSYNSGISWSPSRQWIVKAIYGTAYRTPFAKQLREAAEPDLEQIESLNFQIGWEPSKRWGLNAILFWNELKNHVMQDPYAGLSRPNRQDIRGMELEGHVYPMPSLELSANLTLIDNSGPDEEYRLLLGTFVDEDGNLVPMFEDLSNPYDSGPDVLGNLKAFWRPHSDFTGYLRLGYTSSRRLIFPRGDGDVSTDGIWLLDGAATFRNVFVDGLDVQVSVKNAFDRGHETPGTYTMIDGDPFRAQIEFRKTW